MTDEFKVLNDYITKKNLRESKHRKEILKLFLEKNKHFTIDEIANELKNRNEKIGQATIYRNIKVLLECKIIKELRLDNGSIKYERVTNRKHHDHLICYNCGKIIEFQNDMIEKLQLEVTNKYNFKLLDHTLQLYGLCENCK